jgi:hypothetical protein
VTQIAECPECGNTRGLFGECPHCGSSIPPPLAVDVLEFNIKQGNRSVEDALEILAVKIRDSPRVRNEVNYFDSWVWL